MAGELIRPEGRRWKPVHLACNEARGAAVVATTFSSGDTIYQNAAGRCEDAPCCGCCT
jgi:hypothetical protein